MTDKRGAMNLSDNFKIAILTAIIFIAIMLVSAYKIWPEIQEKGVYKLKEGPLEKIALQIKSKETYAYSYRSGEQNTNVTYTTVQGAGCVLVSIKEIKNTPSVCIKSDGTDSSGSNISLSNPLVYFFKPWMLAAKGGWGWDVKMTANITSEEIPLYTFSFRGLNKTTYKGRNAIVVSASEYGDNEPILIMIDEEKRVLLREEGAGYVIELISAPFPLEQQAE